MVDISKTNKFGASDTNVKDLSSNFGTLALFPQAAQFAESLVPKTTTISPEEQAFLFFTKMAAEASKPGATAIGAAGEAGQDLVKTRIAQKALESKRAGDVASVASSIFSAIKPKVGAPSTKMIGIAVNDAGEPIYDNKGKQLFQYQLFGADGTAQGKPFNAPRSEGTTIDMGGEKAYATGAANDILEYYRGSGKGDTYTPGVLAKVDEAQDQINRLNRMEELLDDPDFKTGLGQDKINAMKQILNRLGFTDYDQIDFAKADTFNSISNQITLGLVSQMKGALSDKELGFLAGIAPSLNKTKEGNRLLIMMTKHALQKNLEFPEFFKQYKERNGIDPDATVLLMRDDIKASQKEAAKLREEYQRYQRRERPNLYEFVKGLAEKESRELQDRGVDPRKIKQLIEEKYLLTEIEAQYRKNF